MSQENIIYGAPGMKLKYPDKSLAEYFLENLTFYGNKPSQVDAITQKFHSYDEILSLSLKLAENLMYGFESRKWHIGTGHYISIYSENSINYCIPLLAAFYLGAAVAPLSPSYSESELKYALGISKPRVVFASKSILAKIVDVARGTGFVQSVIVMDEVIKDSSGSRLKEKGLNDGFILSINDLLYPGEKLLTSMPFKDDLPKVHKKEQVALLLYSSGTTGLPKGAMLTQHNILTTLNLIFNINREDIILGHLPFCHVLGMVHLLRTLFLGLKNVILPHFERDLFLGSIEKYKVTTVSIVPTLAVFLTKDPRVTKYDLSSLRMITCGSAFLGKDLQKKVENVVNKTRIKAGFPPCLLLQGYGLSETFGVAFDRGESQKHGTVGTLFPGMQGKVIHLETGKSLEAHNQGELCIRGPVVMKGYLGDPKATATAIDKDGWFHTGDIGYYDDEGYLYIVDRLKEIIKYKGFQVSPAELESLLLTYPNVEDAAVIGVPDEYAGEFPMAVIVKRSGKDLTEAEIVKFVADHVSPQKRLHGGVRFVKYIPKTSNGKILRRVLRKEYTSKL